MADQTAADAIKRLGQMSTQRHRYEDVWRQAADVAAPDAPDFHFGMLDAGDQLLIHRPKAAERSRKIYDATAVWAADRLSSGLEGLIMPQSETWHGLETDDLLRLDTTDEETEWLEALTRFLFRTRYDAQSGWQTAIQTCLRRLVVFGNSFMYVDEGFDSAICRYRHIPLNEIYIAEDHWGNLESVYRIYTLTAAQAVSKFGERVSQKIKTAANDPSQMDKPFRFLQCVGPRGDFGSYSDGVMKARWHSLHIEYDEKLVVGESGFFEMPFIDFRWLPEPGRLYGEGPVMRALADIQSMQVMAKNELIASQQAVKPPLLVARNGVMNRPNLNPNAINVGGIDANGRKMIEPLLMGQRIDFAQAVIQAKRNNLRESLYINLFAVLVDNPRQSATEALIRAQEKGELLGPAGSRIQESLARLVERELGILSRRRLFERGSMFEVPRTFQNRKVGPKFTSPLDKIRRSKEAEGTIRTLEIMTPIIQMQPELADNFDGDTALRGVAEVVGMPRRFLRREDEVQQRREARAQQDQQNQMLMQAQAAAKAAKDAAPAMAQMAEAQ